MAEEWRAVWQPACSEAGMLHSRHEPPREFTSLPTTPLCNALCPWIDRPSHPEANG